MYLRTIGVDNMNMECLNLNSARAFKGRNVNLHLKDGSVLINVYVVEARREKNNGKPAIFCLTQRRKSPIKLRLKDVAWMDQLNPHILH